MMPHKSQCFFSATLCRTNSISSIIRSSLQFVTTDARMASRIRGSSSILLRTLVYAAQSAAGCRAGTISPKSPTIFRTSPTSVATTGTAQAIASPTALGKLSPNDEDRVAMSNALHIARILTLSRTQSARLAVRIHAPTDLRWSANSTGPSPTRTK
jgi:hypothetical protein